MIRRDYHCGGNEYVDVVIKRQQGQAAENVEMHLGAASCQVNQHTGYQHLTDRYEVTSTETSRTKERRGHRNNGRGECNRSCQPNVRIGPEARPEFGRVEESKTERRQALRAHQLREHPVSLLLNLVQPL